MTNSDESLFTEEINKLLDEREQQIAQGKSVKVDPASLKSNTSKPPAP